MITKAKKVEGSSSRHSIIDRLLIEVLSKILALVGSLSSKYLFNSNVCCKAFTKAAEDAYVTKHIIIDDIVRCRYISNMYNPRIVSKVDDFLAKCLSLENPHSLFKEGMRKIFGVDELEDGLKVMRLAFEKGLKEATFVFGMLLLSQGGENIKEGLHILNSEYNAAGRKWDINQSFRKFQKNLYYHSSFVVKEISMECPTKDHTQTRIRKYRVDKEIKTCAFCMRYS